jgi:alkylation response protein AidB-like acyl-CoA dehydrogenase
VLAIRQFVDKSLVPVVAEHEAAGRYPGAIVGELAELGLLGALVDPARGGLGLDLGATAMLLEEVARGWTTVAAAAAGHLIATWALERFAAPAEREARLPRLARGERLATTVLGGAVTAHRDAGAWTLAGTTSLTDNAPRADLVLLRAVAGGRDVLALIERGVPGLHRGDPQATIGVRGLDPCALRLDGVRPALVLEGDAAAQAIGVACVAAAAVAVGLAQAAFEAALRYSQQRTTFGQPLCQHQAVQLKLADMATGITAARLLTYHAASGEPLDPAAGAMARLAAAKVAAEATLESMRIHGGYGYVSEFPVERFYRDAARLPFVPLDDETLRRDVAAHLVGSA